MIGFFPGWGGSTVSQPLGEAVGQSRKMLHLGVKLHLPSNIGVAPAKLCDFGWASHSHPLSLRAFLDANPLRML